MQPGRDSVVFHTASGPLSVYREDDGFRMDLPARTVSAVPTPPALSDALGIVPVESSSDGGNKGIPEDPVTGGAHCALVPFWAAKTGKVAFVAHQASAPRGDLVCRLVGDRVHLRGSCALYLDGHIELWSAPVPVPTRRREGR